jgi:hypothetical protein
MTNGWKLDRTERDALLRDHPPKYEDVVADHVTFDVKASAPPHPVKGATAPSTGRTGRPITSPGRSVPGERRRKATTC